MFTSYSIQRRNSGTKDTNFFAREEDRMTPVGSNFLCGHPHIAEPPPHLHAPPEPDSLPLCGCHKWIVQKSN